jgi:hypothetical protein
MVELHVDDNEVFEKFSLETHMGGNLSVRFPTAEFNDIGQCKHGHSKEHCKCHLPVWHMGQDESIFKAFQRSKRQWVVGGIRGLRKKTDGPGEMVCAFQDRHLGFGFPMTEAQMQFVNEFREQCGKIALDRSPGIRFLEYRNMENKAGTATGKEGWWDWDKFEVQLVDLVEAFELLYPGYQLMVEIDWSAGHSKHRVGALNAIPMGVGYGGGQPIMRDSVIERAEVFLGAGAQLSVGDTQCMIFKEGDQPPHFEPNAPKYDILASEGAKAREGYVGKAKGLRQILWERGLYFEGMIKTIPKHDKKGRDSSYSMVEVPPLIDALG